MTVVVGENDNRTTRTVVSSPLTRGGRSPLPVYRFDPLHDSRWPVFLQQHPRASVFHTPGWLQALQLTYGYEPVAYTTSPPGDPLSDGWVFCLVDSWLTGRRMVSLPFSDHCEPLVDDPATLEQFSESLRREGALRKWRYIEARPCSVPLALDSFQASQRFCLHALDLRPDLDQLFAGFHRDSVRRKIRRSERECLVVEQGRSPDLLQKFCSLFRLTRERHHLAPPPRAWFRNMVDNMGDQLKVHVASKDGVPIASILTLQFKNKVVYKYGGSDAHFHRYGGIQRLFWTVIQQAKQAGLTEFDLGRSDLDNEGLIVFKNRWGAVASELAYARCRCCRTHNLEFDLWNAKHLLSHVPRALLPLTGRMVYRHIG